MTAPRRMLSATQVAELLGKSIRTIQRLAEAGELPAEKMPGHTGAYVFDATEVELWRYRRLSGSYAEEASA